MYRSQVERLKRGIRRGPGAPPLDEAVLGIAERSSVHPKSKSPGASAPALSYFHALSELRSAIRFVRGGGR